MGDKSFIGFDANDLGTVMQMRGSNGDPALQTPEQQAAYLTKLGMDKKASKDALLLFFHDEAGKTTVFKGVKTDKGLTFTESYTPANDDLSIIPGPGPDKLDTNVTFTPLKQPIEVSYDKENSYRLRLTGDKYVFPPEEAAKLEQAAKFAFLVKQADGVELTSNAGLKGRHQSPTVGIA